MCVYIYIYIIHQSQKRDSLQSIFGATFRSRSGDWGGGHRSQAKEGGLFVNGSRDRMETLSAG